MHFVKGERKGK